MCFVLQVKNVRNHQLDNRMESFFLAETAKYLYLLFAEDHWMHNNGGSGTLWTGGNRKCVIDAGGYIFNSGGSFMSISFSLFSPILFIFYFLRDFIFKKTLFELSEVFWLECLRI